MDDTGARFGAAITFTIDPATDRYAGKLAHEIVVQRLATAVGQLGSAADYLFSTCDGLRAEGIPDPELERLADAVRAARVANALG
jgi:cation transport protein ChaC